MVEINLNWLRRCTEIPVLLIFYSFMICDPVTTNFIIYRTCTVSLHYNESECGKLGSKEADNFTKALEKVVEPHANIIMMTQSLLSQVVPALFCLFLGPWSDRHGRKPVLISTITGFALASITSLIVALIPTLSAWYLLLGSIPAVMFGGFSPFLMAILCYITDITTEENRGMRIGIFEATLAFGMLLGTLSSSYIFFLGGYIAVFSLGAISECLACLYVIFVISETVLCGNDEDSTSIFTFKNITDMLKATFRARRSYIRSILLLAISMATIFILASNSDTTVFFMFLREKLGWKLEQYTLYRSVRELLWIIGTFVGLSFLHKLLKIKEAPMLLIGFMAYFVGVLLQGFATKDWHIYLAGGIRCISGVVSPMCRSLISKLILKEETGKVFSLTITVESLTALIGAPLYTFIYNYTLNTNPGAFNFLTAGMFGIEIILVVAVIVIQHAMSNTQSLYTILSEEE